MFRPLIALLAGLTLAATACAQPVATGPAPTTRSEPRSGGQLNLRLSGDFVSFDLTRGAGRDPNISALARNRLVGYKSGPDVKYEDAILEPELAERWEVSSDARTFTFYLRKGVKFHDVAPANGRELTSADVKASFEYWGRTGPFADKKLAPSRINAPVEFIEKLDTPDATTIVVRTKEPYAPYVSVVADPATVIYPREILEGADGHPHDKVIGTGPFWLDAAAGQKGTRYVWKKHASYWEQGKPYLDEIRHLLIQNEGTGIAAFQAGQLDMMTEDIDPRTGAQIAKAVPSAVVYKYFARPDTLTFNMRPGAVFNDERLRKAVSLALDRDEFIKTYALGQGQWSHTIAAMGLFTSAEVKQMLRFDPTEAAKLVKDAGYANGVNVDTIFSSQDGEGLASRLTLAQAQLKKVGINMTLKPLENVDFVARRKIGEFEFFIFQSNFAPDLDPGLSSYADLKHPTNYPGMNDPAFNALVSAQRREADPAKRREALRTVVRYINEHYAVGQNLYSAEASQFWYPYVKGNYPNFAGCCKTYAPRLQEIWLDK